MPRDTNPIGTIFGGVILSYVDQAAAVAALRHAHCVWVTASMERVDFIAPVFLGDIVELYAHTTREGNKSVTVCIEVDALRHNTGEPIRVTTATVTMVSLDRTGQPVPSVRHRRHRPTRHSLTRTLPEANRGLAKGDGVCSHARAEN